MKQTQTTVSADNNCFVCGSENAAGLKLDFQIDRKRRKAAADTIIADRFQGWKGVIHGGIIAALLDEAAIYACRSLAFEAVTAELNIRYRKPVPTGQSLHIEAEVTAIRRRIIQTRSQLTINGELYAEAEGKVVLLPTAESN